MNALIFIWVIVLALAASSVAALIWAIGAGQFDASQRTAESIFDADEPIGTTTDRFPNTREPQD